MPNPFGNFSGSFGSGDIIAYLGVGNTSQYAASLKTADQQAQQFSKNVSMALNVVAVAGAAIFVGAVKAASDFESSFAGVLKTVDGLDDGFGNLTEAGKIMAQQMRDLALEIPVSVNELNKIAELGGQLGIATDDLVEFTDTIARLGVSTDMTIEAAATEMARFVNITKQVAPEGMTAAAQIERIGSTIVDLGNNFATTESEISAMAQRLAGAGSQIGLSQAEILGMSAALTSVGINAEAGGTAFSKMFIKMASAVDDGGDKLEKFAKVAGVSTSEFAEMFEKDAAGAVAAFVTGLGKVNDKGGSTFKTLEDLGMSEIRLRDSLLRASGASDIFNNALARSKTAYEENNALTLESEKRFLTFESQLKLLKNVFNEAFIELGNKFLPKLTEFVELLTESPEKVAKFIENLGKIIIVLGGFAVIAKIVIAVNALNTAMIGLGITAKGLVVAGGPITLLIAGITALMVAAMKLQQHEVDEVISGKSLKELNAELVILTDLEGKLRKDMQSAGAFGMDSISRQLEDTKAKIEGVNEAIVTMSDKEGLATQSAGELTDAEKALAEMSSKYETQIKSLQLEISALTKEQEDAIEPIKDYSDKILILNDTTGAIRGEFRGLTPEIVAVGKATEDTGEKTKDANIDWSSYLSLVRDIVNDLPMMKGASQTAKEGLNLVFGGLSQLLAGGIDPVTLGLQAVALGMSFFSKPEISRSIEQIENRLKLVGVSLQGIDDLLGMLPDNFQSNLLDYYSQVLDEAVVQMETATGDVYDDLVAKAKWAADEIKRLTASFGFGEAYNELFLSLQSITEYTLEQLDLFGDVFTDKFGDDVADLILEQIMRSFTMLGDLDPGSLAFNQLFDQIESAFSALIDLVGPDAAMSLFDEWTTMFGAFLEGDELDSFNQWIAELMMLLFGVGDAAGAATDDIQRLINVALSAGAITIGGGRLGIGGLHTGGIVTAHNGIVTAHNGLSSGSEVIAKLQRGEAVINRSVVGMHGASAFQELNRSGSLRGFGQGEKQQTQNFIYVDVHEAGPAAYAEVTEQVYPRIKDKQRNYEPGENPY
jgi:TP901 family phage tail tape measure protein